MTWVKICGTTNLEDALTAIDAGADALGFVFYEKSPRNVDPEVAREIIAQLPEKIEKVGVFADASVLRATETASLCGLTAVQFHLPFSSEIPRKQTGPLHAVASGRFKKIFSVFSASDLMGDEPRINVDFASFGRMSNGETMDHNPFGTVFLDSGNSQQPGGTGKTFDWNAAAPLVETMSKSVKVVVAGGLNPSNITEAIRILKPWGVDVVSGVEASPGKKDPEKVRAFINAVRQSEKIV